MRQVTRVGWWFVCGAGILLLARLPHYFLGKTSTWFDPLYAGIFGALLCLVLYDNNPRPLIARMQRTAHDIEMMLVRQHSIVDHLVPAMLTAGIMLVLFMPFLMALGFTVVVLVIIFAVREVL